MKVKGILAHDRDYVIGKGDHIPWHHSGDFKRFKQITDGHHLLMGVRTFLGIATNYFNVTTGGKQVLPGRTIFVLGSPRAPLGSMTQGEYRSIHKRGYGSDWNQLVHELTTEFRRLGIDYSNVRIINEGPSEPPHEILDRIEMNYLWKGGTLFIAGGAQVYHKYLPWASTIFRTVVNTHVATSDDLVKLTPKTISLLNDARRWHHVPNDTEVSNDLEASYSTLITEITNAQA